jgi:phage anti-repressor protein
MNTINIAKLIDNNSMTRLSKDYENIMINKIKNIFTDKQQNLFVASFYCYLNYDTKKDFVIDFNNVWKWLGFTRKDSAKKLLEKNFTIDIDFKVDKTAPPVGGAVFDTINGGQNFTNDIDTDFKVEKAAPPMGGAFDTINGGQNKEEIMLTINTFKKFCLKAGTKKAEEVHEYYIKLEELLQETINEENDELRIQLTNTNNEKLKLEENNEDLKKKLTKKYNNKKYPEGNCLYVITNKLFPNYYKLGLSKNFNTRLQSYDQLCPKGHTVIYFRLVYCNEEVEKIIKKILCDSVSQNNREEWFELEDKNILLNAVTSICDTIDLFLPRQNGEIVNNNKKRELKNPFLLDTKECSICNLKKPLESFYIAKEHTDDKENSCKECVKIRQKEFIENKRKTEEIPKEKECTNCKKILPLDDYFVDNEKFDRKATKCKICVLEVRNSNKKYLEITEYCCATCNITKHIDLFHKLESSMTGHKYSCKICELKKAKERYNQKRIIELEINPENAADDKTEDRKQKQKESYERRINTKIECPCGSVTNLAQQSKHKKTNKHLRNLKFTEDAEEKLDV